MVVGTEDKNATVDNAYHNATVPNSQLKLYYVSLNPPFVNNLNDISIVGIRPLDIAGDALPSKFHSRTSDQFVNFWSKAHLFH